MTQQIQNIISLSGGKDSTATLLMLLEKGESIADIVFFDGGWEFPEMYDHIEKLERFIGRSITRLQPRLPIDTVTDKSPFDYLFSEVPVRKRASKEIRFYGRGWPHPLRRWCTNCKQTALKAHTLAVTHRQGLSLPLHQCIGFAADETKRTEGITKKASSVYYVQRYPLIELGVPEVDALAYCKKRGFDWGGLYDHFSRVSCFCCPLQSDKELRTIRNYYPSLWQRMLEMETWLSEEDRKRRVKGTTISELEDIFSKEILA